MVFLHDWNGGFVRNLGKPLLLGYTIIPKAPDGFELQHVNGNYSGNGSSQ